VWRRPASGGGGTADGGVEARVKAAIVLSSGIAGAVAMCILKQEPLERIGVKTFLARTVGDWHNWLAQYHDSEPEGWLVFYKQHTGITSIDRKDALDEALCFGWVERLATGLLISASEPVARRRHRVTECEVSLPALLRLHLREATARAHHSFHNGKTITAVRPQFLQHLARDARAEIEERFRQILGVEHDCPRARRETALQQHGHVSGSRHKRCTRCSFEHPKAREFDHAEVFHRSFPCSIRLVYKHDCSCDSSVLNESVHPFARPALRERRQGADRVEFFRGPQSGMTIVLRHFA